MAKIYTALRHFMTYLVPQRIMRRKLILCCIFLILNYSLCEECMTESECLTTYHSVHYCIDLICPNVTTTSTTTVPTTPLKNSKTPNSYVSTPSPPVLPKFENSDSFDDHSHTHSSEIMFDLDEDRLNDTLLPSPDTLIPSNASDTFSENSSEEFDSLEYPEMTDNTTIQLYGNTSPDSGSDQSSETNFTGPTTPLSTVLTSNISIFSLDDIDAEDANNTSLEAPEGLPPNQSHDESMGSMESNDTQYFDTIEPLYDENSSTVIPYCDPELIATPNTNSTDPCKDYYDIPFLAQVPAVLLKKYNSILFYYTFVFFGHKILWPFISHNNLRLLFLFAVGRMYIEVEHFNFILLVYGYHHASDPFHLSMYFKFT